MQGSELRKIGVEAVIFCFSGRESGNLSDQIHIPLGSVGPVGKERRIGALVQLASKESVDVLYVRRELWHPAYKKMMSAIPTVVEINTLEREEYKLTLPLWRRMYASLTNQCWYKYPAGYVSVTKELARNLPIGRPVEVISNGIPQSYPVKASLPQGPHLFFSCTGSYPWHGIDKFVTMARMFPDWEFSFVGEFPDELQGRIPSNLKCHGRLTSGDADKLLETANIGVGTLALHRKGMTEACPLKLRSYLAYGLPSIIAYTDTDFSGEHPFICEIKNTEENIIAEQEKIRAFVMANYRQRVKWRDVEFASEAEKARLRAGLFRKVLVGSEIKG